MRIIPQAAPELAPSSSESAAMQALKKELEQLKAEVAAMRDVKPVTPPPMASLPVIPMVSVPSPAAPMAAEPVAPVVSRRSPDPLFAQLWTYIKTDK